MRECAIVWAGKQLKRESPPIPAFRWRGSGRSQGAVSRETSLAGAGSLRGLRGRGFYWSVVLRLPRGELRWAPGWPAAGRSAECGAASGVLAPRLRQTGVETESDSLGGASVLKISSGEADTPPWLKPSPLFQASGAGAPRGSLRVWITPSWPVRGGSSALRV